MKSFHKANTRILRNQLLSIQLIKVFSEVQHQLIFYAFCMFAEVLRVDYLARQFQHLNRKSALFFQINFFVQAQTQEKQFLLSVCLFLKHTHSKMNQVLCLC